MIEVRNLTKRYGNTKAVTDLNFTIESGKIYGFLGPNGAGKSTTMNIITGCLSATEGTVLIDGHDIFEEPVEAKKRIGYLPEQPPLYVDMTPREYLKFVGQAKGVKGEHLKKRIAYVMEKTEIIPVQNCLIKNLSKGYKQRVGIAQALIADPETIILDEPTVGLDPKQVIGIRKLIRELGEDHTVILSSHILTEVNSVCDYIIIISEGKLKASEEREALMGKMSDVHTLRYNVRGKYSDVVHALDGLDIKKEIRPSREAESVELIITVDDKKFEKKSEENTPVTDLRDDIFFALANAGCAILSMQMDSASLEDVFLELTKGGNEDGSDL